MARPVYEPATEAEALALVGAAVKKNFPDGLFTGRVKSVDASEKPFWFKVEYEDGECEDLEWSELLEVLDQALAPAASKRSAEGANAAGPSKKQKKKAADDEAELRAILDSMDDEENEAPAQQQQQQAPSRKRAAATVTGAHGPSDDKQQPEERQQQQQQQQKKKAQTQTQERTQTQQVQPQQTTQRHGQQQGQGQQQQHAPRAGPSGAAQQGGSSMRTSGGAGHLEMIRLENFMCHELFEMTFGPHVTLVSGTNGSGKSAVMQGLQAALGVSARETGRAQKLAQFIRTGSTEARVQVTIFNTGPDAFEPERLGNRFTIDRRLVASGAGGTWRVLDAQGKHVAKLKPSDVLKHLAINASNPMTIITQDMARAFLSGSGDDKRRKYDMFMEGTLLEVIMEDLGSAQSNLVIAKGRLKEVKDQYTEKIKELNVLQSSLDKLRDVDDLVLIHGDMNVSLVWSYVWKSREEIAVIANQLNVIGPRKIAEITAVIEAKSALLAETCEQEKTLAVIEAKSALLAETCEQEKTLAVIEAKSALLTEACEQEKTLTNQMNASNEAASHINADVAQLRANMKGYTKDRVKLQQTKHQLDAEIDSLRGQKLEYERSLAEDTSERAAEQRAKMAAAEAQVASLRAGVDSAEAALAEQRSRLTDAQSRLAQAKDRLRGVQKTQDGMRYELNNFERQKQDLQASATESVARFGGKAVVQLLKLIHDARPGTFDRPPIGPVGAFLGLKDTRYDTLPYPGSLCV
ncbi:hypothetical protein FOA52_012386 [Chlamydomonas sp. UWO 241]|nr:hypothetical protein FOA52_012386 [Chlamydomonas sp. UWO 241]